MTTDPAAAKSQGPSLANQRAAKGDFRLRELRAAYAKEKQLVKLQVGDRDFPDRWEAAESLWELFRTWGDGSTINKQFASLTELKAKEYKVMMLMKWSTFDHFATAARVRAFQARAKWCKEEVEPEDRLEPTVVAFLRYLSAQKARSSPLAGSLVRLAGISW